MRCNRERLALWLLYLLLLLAGLAVVAWWGLPVFIAAAQTPLPACPPQDSLGQGTPWPGPDDLSYDYLAQCAHCLASTPTPTSLLATYLPTPSATVPAASDWYADCPSSYQFTVGDGGAAFFPARLADRAVFSPVYAAIFRPVSLYDYSFWLSPWDAGFEPTNAVPMWLYTSDDDGMALSGGQTYCAAVRGYEFLCERFAPGAARLDAGVVPTTGEPWLPQPRSGQPLALPFAVSGEGAGDVWLLDVRLVGYGPDALDCGPATPTPTASPTVTPTATPTPSPSAVPASLKWSDPLGCASPLMCQRLSDYVVRVQWNAPAGDWQAINVQRPSMTGTAQTMQIITLPAGGDGVPYWEWRDQCGAEMAQYWFPNVFSANGFGRGFYQWEYVTVAGIEGRRAYYKDLYGAAVYGPAGEIRACPAQVGDPPPRSYDFYLIIEKVGGVETSWGEVFAQTTPTPTPVFYREAARQELQMAGDDSECWHYGSLEYPNLNAAASPVMGVCYTVSLAGDDGVEFAEMDASHDGYDATWLSFWPDTSGTGAGVYETCVSDGWASFSAGAVCAQACPAASRVLTVGDWPKVQTGSYAATFKAGCWKQFQLQVSDFSLIYYGQPPTPMPMPTATAVWVTPTPRPTVDADRCARFEWRERLPAGEVGVDWEDLVTPGDCYVVVPSVHLSLPGLPLGIGGAQELSWDGLGLCVNWVRFPTVQVLGVALSIDWFLLPAMVWFLNRILTL